MVCIQAPGKGFCSYPECRNATSDKTNYPPNSIGVKSNRHIPLMICPYLNGSCFELVDSYHWLCMIGNRSSRPKKKEIAMYGVFKPVYTDLIASVIKVAINRHSITPDSILCGAGKINWDLNEEGSMVSTRKTINVSDMNGRIYLITIEEVTK